MTGFKCPGSDDRNLKVEIRICPRCQREVEVFSDEMRVACPHCKAWVERKMLPACADWCKSARECLGEEKWQKLKGKGRYKK
ncbi:MAG: phosphohydrolase [Candidatus Omnitrophota bacterium]